ncbi:HAD family hydrolase [Dongshaea marina]|uniref:HAD family hydrolase n=1 Tax=Dongshaea marina TaxID=2047966 RepID=UPI000D3E4C43|nr:HAD family phosphatase [Dongshaea marina]
MKELQAVIFDFNGVLLQDSALHEKAWFETIRELAPAHPCLTGDFAVFIHGKANRDLFETVLDKKLSEPEAHQYSERKEGRYRQLCLELGDAFKLTPGAPELLARLKAAEIPFTIATASCQHNLEFFQKHLHLSHWFDLANIIYADGSIPCKPHPAFYLKAAEALGLSPEQCMVIEDSVAGVQSAKAAGIGRVVGFIGDAPQTNRGKLLAAGADEVINGFEEFPLPNLGL